MKDYPDCQLCDNEKARYDGKTVMGPWAYMCPTCFRMFGVGLGLGRGQRLVLSENIDGTFSMRYMVR